MAAPKDDLIAFQGGVLVADMISDSTATDDIELTQYPIETGSFISDHAIVKPRTLELTLVQTETPIAGAGISSPKGAQGFRTQSVELSVAARPPATQQGQADVPQAKIQLTLQGLGAAVVGALGGGPAREIRWTGQKTDEPAAVKQFRVSVLQADQDVARVNEFHDALLRLQLTAELLTVTVKGQQWFDMILVSVKRTDPQGKAGCATFGLSLQQVRTVVTETVELPPVPEETKKVSRGKVDPPEADAVVEKKRRSVLEAALFTEGSI